MDITLFKETLDAISLFDWFFFLFVFFRQRKKKKLFFQTKKQTWGLLSLSRRCSILFLVVKKIKKERYNPRYITLLVLLSVWFLRSSND